MGSRKGCKNKKKGPVWMSGCELCNIGIIKHIMQAKERGESIKSACEEMSTQTDGLWTPEQIQRRFFYYTEKKKTTTKRSEKEGQDTETTTEKNSKCHTSTFTENAFSTEEEELREDISSKHNKSKRAKNKKAKEEAEMKKEKERKAKPGYKKAEDSRQEETVKPVVDYVYYTRSETASNSGNPAAFLVEEYSIRSTQDACNFLGTSTICSNMSIRATIRAAVMEAHPDKGGTDSMMQKVLNAKAMLEEWLDNIDETKFHKKVVNK